MSELMKNSNSKIDRAIEKFDRIETFLRQRYDTLCSRDDAFISLKKFYDESIQL